MANSSETAGNAKQLMPVARYLIWGAGVVVALGVGAAVILLSRQIEQAPKEIPETLETAQVDVRGPNFPAADLTFGTDGVALLTAGVGRDVALDAAGRIVVLGRTGINRIPRLAVWRLSAAGKLDTTFGTGGVTLVPSAFSQGTTNYGEFGQALAIDGKGRIVIAGYIQDTHERLHAAAWRLTDQGQMDLSFHKDGRITFPRSSAVETDDSAKAVAIDARGRIVVAGSSWPGDVDAPGPREYLVVWRLTETGEPDRSFHGSGLLTVPETRANALAVDSAGRILVAGATLGPRFNWGMAVWRFLSDGGADPEWNGGEVVMPQTADRGFLPTAAAGIAVTPDGKVTVLGVVYDRRRLSDVDDNGVQMVALWRFMKDGSPDPAFGRTAFGVVLADSAAGAKGIKAGDFGRALAIDAHGRLAVTGSSRDARNRRLLAVWRRTNAGAPDGSLGNGGATVQTDPPEDIDAGPNAVGSSIAADGQGRFVLAGSVHVGDQRYLAVWRLKP